MKLLNLNGSFYLWPPCLCSFGCQKINCGPSIRHWMSRPAQSSWLQRHSAAERWRWPPEPVLPISADYKGFCLISKFPLTKSIPLFVFFFSDVPLDLEIFWYSYQSVIRKSHADLRGALWVPDLMYLCSLYVQYEGPLPSGPHLYVNVCILGKQGTRFFVVIFSVSVCPNRNIPSFLYSLLVNLIKVTHWAFNICSNDLSQLTNP